MFTFRLNRAQSWPTWPFFAPHFWTFGFRLDPSPLSSSRILQSRTDDSSSSSVSFRVVETRPEKFQIRLDPSLNLNRRSSLVSSRGAFVTRRCSFWLSDARCSSSGPCSLVRLIPTASRKHTTTPDARQSFV